MLQIFPYRRHDHDPPPSSRLSESQADDNVDGSTLLEGTCQEILEGTCVGVVSWISKQGDPGG